MSENQEDLPKPDVPPPSLGKKPVEPPPPSALTRASSPPPPPSLSAPPPPPPVQEAGGSPLKVRVKPDSGDDDGDDEEARGPVVSLATRAGAFLIDVGIAAGLYIAAVSVLPGFAEKAASLLALGYIVSRDGLPFLNGQSVGKTAMKIKAVTLDDKSLAGNWQPALVRNVVLLIPLFPLIELIVLLTREDKHDQGVRLGDEWAKTKVVPAVLQRDAGEEEDAGIGGEAS